MRASFLKPVSIKYLVFEKNIHKLFFDFNIPSLLSLEVFSPKMYKFLVEKYKFSTFVYEFFKVKSKNC